MGLLGVELFYKMPSILIAEETYVCVLQACSHAGLINEAQVIFNTINEKTEKIYTAMVS